VDKEVGDKAYLVLKQHNKPEHYSEITNLINKAKFDARVAYKETVHNELIKDKRFILVGRGIYALSEWGFKPGVVADVIKEILVEAQKPLPKDKIIEEVLKKRHVKKNTILVGLSNKQYFKKVDKNLYTLVENN
jgi:DNA-directed RNA polymerase delta subunit